MHLQGFGEFSNALNATLFPFLRSRKRSVHVMTKNSFSVRLFRARVDKGISQSELASAAEVAPAQVSRYEAGRNIPRPHVAAKLAAALDVDVDWLMAGAELAEEDGGTPAQGVDAGEFVFQPSPENLEKLKALSTLTGKTPDELVQQMFAEMEAHLLGDPKIASEFLSDLTRQSAAAAAQKVTVLQAKGSHALEMGQPTIKQGPPPDPEAKD